MKPVNLSRIFSFIKKQKTSEYRTLNNRYNKLRFSQKQIEKEEYKEHLGGGNEFWDLRGKFQLLLMQQLRLKQNNTLLDIGCGPIRAGSFLIPYLNTNNYYGFDSNKDFINIANQIVKNNEALNEKSPTIFHLENFDFSAINKKFDFILLWSVLNYCTQKERISFFQKVQKLCHNKTLIVISHTAWFSPSYLQNTKLVIDQEYKMPHELSTEFNSQKYGWKKERSGGFPLKVIKLNKK